MMKSIREIRVLIAIVSGLFCQSVLADEIIMSAPPRENQQEAEALYNPLAKIFSEILGRPVRYVYPDNWLNYQREMRRGNYDIAFDGPHFASWRIKHLEHDLLVKLTGTIQFVTFVNKRNKSVETLNDLIGKKICSISPPNLSALTILDTYKNPVQQPILFGIRGGMETVVNRFNSGACEAAVVRESYYKKKLSLEDRDRTKVLFQSKPLPNQAFTVSKKLSAADVAKLASAIQYGNAKDVIDPIAKRFGGKEAEFLAAETSEYFDQRLLLEGVILGW
jgi:ABC-type phosphate/phosphonate transport system substrate-binding protein